MDPREQLAQRPSFEEAEKGYLALLTDLRSIVDEQQPGLRWNEAEPVRSDRGGCGQPFDRVDGAKNGNYTFDGAEGAVEDANWQRTLDAMKAPLAAQGFTELQVLQDEPGAHEVSVGDPATGARVVFGTKTGTILTLYGGCFLLEAGS